MIKLFSILLFSLPFMVIGQTQNFWTKKADFGGLKRERAVAFSLGDYGYVCAGVDTAEIVLKDLWRFDPVMDTWMQMADLPGSKRRDAIAFTVDDKGYVGSGIDNDESMSGLKLKDFWEYNPLSNVWVQIADFPGAGGMGIYFSTGFSIDSKGYLCGGKIGPNNYTNQLWEYKPSINLWTQRTDFPGGDRYQLSSFTIGYYGYVGLGADQDILNNDFWKYNGGTNQWTQISDLPASERGSACTFTIGQQGYVCMGSDGGYLDDLWEYNPSINQWAVRAPYGGTARKNAIAFAINGKAYVGTGKGFSGKKAGMEEYTPYELLGIDELAENQFAVYPNPSQDQFSIDVPSESIASFSIFSTDGKLIRTIQKDHTNKLQIERDDLNSGVYILVALNKTGIVLNTKQIILL